MNKFAERLKELRIENKLTQSQLAKKVGLSGTGIGQWERNERVPNLDAVIAIAQYFKVSLDYLAGLED